MFNYINPIKIMVLVSFIFALASLRRSNRDHCYLLLILGTCLATEIIDSVLYFFGYSNGLTMSISIIFHDCFWLLLLRRNIAFKVSLTMGLLLFLAFAVANLFLMSGHFGFNYYTFVIGAFIYIVLFLYENFYQLQKENLAFFLSNSYLLLFAPILFFVDLSLMFGFDSKAVTSHRIFGLIKLYDFAIYFVNAAYYFLINIYIYREKKTEVWMISQ